MFFRNCSSLAWRRRTNSWARRSASGKVLVSSSNSRRLASSESSGCEDHRTVRRRVCAHAKGHRAITASTEQAKPSVGDVGMPPGVCTRG